MNDIPTCKNKVTPVERAFCANCQKDTQWTITFFYMDTDCDGDTLIGMKCECGHKMKSTHKILDFEIKFTQTIGDFKLASKRDEEQR